jgi:hypothetical protein
MSKVYRIHPAIGIARLGNAPRSSPDAMFIGPEIPGLPANFDLVTGKFQNFKSSGVRAQAARFRIWEYDDADGMLTAIREVNLAEADVDSIVWSVTLANRKASFFKFNGQQGVQDDFATNGLRNSGIPDADRVDLLEMEATETISGSNSPRKALRNLKPSIPIDLLGELRTDSEGRLLVLGGEGKSDSWDASVHPLNDYANNDGWFDDISDGVVSASLKLRVDGNQILEVPVEGAWVIVGPPDFAPSVGNVVTLFDTMWDVAVRNLDLPLSEAVYGPNGAWRDLALQNQGWSNDDLPSDYRPSFALEIFPILNRALQVGWVHNALEFDPNSGPTDAHSSFGPDTWAELANPQSSQNLRNRIFRRLQIPDSPSVWNQMPRTLGDEPYGGGTPAQRLLTLTKVQYALLKKWRDGDFVNDPPFPGPALPEGDHITPWGLDRAALENCVGGAFYPGIEAGWLVRRAEIYAAPFRIERGAVSGRFRVNAGFFSQQMALPWQADFMDCKKESHEMPNPAGSNPLGPTRNYAWWPAQRPDDVFVGPDGQTMVPWARGLNGHLAMVNEWASRGFVVDDGSRKYEVEGPENQPPVIV